MVNLFQSRLLASILLYILHCIDGNLADTSLPFCPPGSYHDGNTCLDCPGGSFGIRSGLFEMECTGKCSGGYYCPPGSNLPTQVSCGGPEWYCPPGSSARFAVERGYYTLALTFTEYIDSTTLPTSNFDAQYRCEPGFYCLKGIRRPCPAGVYGARPRLSSPQCTRPCPFGMYCPENTYDPLECPAGTYGNESGLKTPQCSGLCPTGHYCESRTITPEKCPAGSFGGERGLISRKCSKACSITDPHNPHCTSSLCPSGYYCPLGTTQPKKCGGRHVFCPEGSGAPTIASPGYYTISNWSALGDITLATSRKQLEDAYIKGNKLAEEYTTSRSQVRECEPGHYCLEGVKQLCPSGVYGISSGLSTPACTAPCPAGYFCPAGTIDYHSLPCTKPNIFCNEGFGAPQLVDVGYYSLLDTVSNIVRVDQEICPLGSYCIDGIKYLCPEGTYGDTFGLSSNACSGHCESGYICPMGSVSRTQSACPAGSFSSSGVYCSLCFAGYWCEIASPNPIQHECGDQAVFCPEGSTNPMPVDDGYYGVGPRQVTYTKQELCQVRNVQHLPQCPTHTVGIGGI